jgi:CRISPR-associated protein Cmr2
MEHKAKEEGGRDAFAISVLKHSGESHETVLKWEKNAENLIRIKEIMESLQSDFSAKWIKNIQEEFILITNEGNKFELAHQEMFKAEMKRLIGRSCNLIGKEKNDQVTAISDKADLLISSVGHSFDKFSEALNIAKFINKELKNQ